MKTGAVGRRALAVLLFVTPFTMPDDGYGGWLTAALIVPVFVVWAAATPAIGEHLAAVQRARAAGVGGRR